MTELVHFYDACNPANIPANATVVCAYLDGGCANLAAVKARFPHATVITITTLPEGDLAAHVYDCESGNGTPAQAAQWCKQKLDANQRPSVYTTATNWTQIVADLKAIGVDPAKVDWWEAHWDGIAELSPGSVAKQYNHPPGSGGDYDVSVASPTWSVLPQPAPAPKPKPEGLIKPGSFAARTPSKSRPKTFPLTMWLWHPLKCSGDVKFLRLCLNACPVSEVPHFRFPGLGGFGIKTHNAVKDFQRWQKMRDDGICGPAVWERLGLNPPAT